MEINLKYFLLHVWCCQYQCKWLPGKTRLRNDLLCVERDVNYSLTHPSIHIPYSFINKTCQNSDKSEALIATWYSQRLSTVSPSV